VTVLRFALIPVLALFVTSSAGASLKVALQATKHLHSHLHHLQQAEKDLRTAETDLMANNLGGARKAVSAAIQQVEEAIHHHKHHMSTLTTGNGISTLVHHAKHHHHHGLLQHAIEEMHKAEKAIKEGNEPTAMKDVQAALNAIEAAVASHHKLIGK
jgi:hypothetical protein